MGSLFALMAETGMICVALSGCTSSDTSAPADLQVSASWQPWGDDDYPHLFATLHNQGVAPIHVGPGGYDFAVTGPQGPVSVFWGTENFTRTVHEGTRVVVGLHLRTHGDEGFGLAIDHAFGTPADPPRGSYRFCVGERCGSATLR